jgi:wyosine [tRNA(Phe)-imidazoG37] synthetase (radical SAM superfamily)
MKYVYGPVMSRRLGISLGIDLVPKKTCSFDCIYCQVGRTTNKTIKRDEYVPLEEILREVEEALKNPPRGLDFLSISGSGEPTLHSRIGELLKELRERSPYPLAVITNSSLLFMDEVKEALLLADVILPSLDTANPSVFETLNRPHPELKLEEIIRGLKDFRKVFKGKIWLEVLLCRGINDNPPDIALLKEVIYQIDPDLVHVHTVSRPGAEEYAYPVPEQRLKAIASELGPKAFLVSASSQKKGSSPREDLEERILRILNTRPLSLEDLVMSLGFEEGEILPLIEKLIQKGKIRSRLFHHRLYYEALTK